jgi:hypothetical protein
MRLKDTLTRLTQPDGMPPLVRRGIIAALWLGTVIVAGRVVLHHMASMPTGNGWNDSYVYLGAASDFVSHPSHLYDAAAKQVATPFAQRAFVRPPAGLLPYLPLVPVTRLAGLAVSSSIWTLIDTAALFGAVVIVGRRTGLGWMTLGAATLLISFSEPVRWEIDSGQINGLVLLLIVLSLLRMPHRGSGVLMALALACKPVAAIILLVPLLRRRPGVTVEALLTLAAVNLPIMLLIGTSTTLFYLDSVLPYFLGYTIHDPTNISLSNVLQTWVGGGPLPIHGAFTAAVPQGFYALALLWGTRIAVIVVWLRATVERRLDDTMVFALTLATVPFFSGTIWPHYLLYLLPLALVTLTATRLWVRAVGALSVVVWLWGGRVDVLWLSIILLCVAAAAMLVHKLGWRLPALPFKAQAATP